jgi:hypothetical protein
VSERSLSIRARKKVKAEVERVERARLLALFQKRMELVRNGALAFKQGKIREATTNYFQYIDLLERTKGLKQGGLEPKHFDDKKDIAELLLLSGVFWDLARIHDKISKKNTVRLDFYLDRFVVFSKGLTFERVSAELLRKFLVNGMPNHRKKFKDAHIRLGGNKCFMVTAVEEHCEVQTLPALRNYRDQILVHRFWGRLFVAVYYRVGPTLARGVIRLPEGMQRKLARFFDRIAHSVDRIAH